MQAQQVLNTAPRKPSIPFGAGINPQAAFHFSGGQSNPAGCVRAPYDQWYVSQSSCIDGIPDGYQCNPRYINGVWDRYTPYARDTSACTGNLPPDILPQILDSSSLVDTELFVSPINPLLALNEGGFVGALTFTYMMEGGTLGSVDLKWSQSDNIVNTLFNPVSYYYAVPYETGVARLSLNTLNGHATVTLPFMGMLGKLQFQMTNIVPWHGGTEQKMAQMEAMATASAAASGRKGAARMMRTMTSPQIG